MATIAKGGKMIKKLIEWWRGCSKCDHSDTCKNTEISRDLMPPLSRRRAKPACFNCAHTYRRHDRDKRQIVCIDCGDTIKMGADSAKIKHQR